MTASARSLADALSDHARRHGGKDAIRFLARGEEVTDRITYANLHAAALSVAAGLRTLGLEGRAVVLALPPGIGGTLAFLGTVLAGAVAVTIPFPVTAQTAERVRGILEDANPAALICDTDDPAALPPQPEGSRMLLLDALLATPAMVQAAGPAQDVPAFVQYSSGSTRRPAGVVVTHGNLAANLAMIRDVFGHSDASVGANWLPPSHDMGLVGCVLQGLYVGGLTVLMPPQAFMTRPLRWLKAIEAHGATTAGGPNFGFDLCVRRVTADVARGLDLSRWKVAFCGSEPVRPTTLGAFAERFSVSGFDPAAFMPCYGLAEATLLVSARARGAGAATVSTAGAVAPLVSCGPVAAPGEVALFDADKAEVKGGDGMVCVAGPHVSPGLWDGAAQSVRPYPDEFAGPGGHRFVQTGDIGAWHGDELVITGRSKDICIVHGRKIHATDLEASVLDDPDFAQVFAVAAVTVDGAGGDEVVLLCELDGRAGNEAQATLSTGIAGVIAAQHGLVPRVLQLRRGSLPRTTSGKIRRQDARRMLVAGELETA